MFRKAFIITFDKGVLDGINYTTLHQNLTTAQGILNWWHYLESTYIVIVEFSVTAQNIGDYLQTQIPNKKHFVCEIKLSNYYGWLDAPAWEWINQQISEGIE
jgi:hypothetical protein